MKEYYRFVQIMFLTTSSLVLELPLPLMVLLLLLLLLLLLGSPLGMLSIVVLAVLAALDDPAPDTLLFLSTSW